MKIEAKICEFYKEGKCSYAGPKCDNLEPVDSNICGSPVGFREFGKYRHRGWGTLQTAEELADYWNIIRKDTEAIKQFRDQGLLSRLE